MGRTATLSLVCLTLFLALFPLTLGKPGLPSGLKADEPAYYLMALSLAHDRDLKAEARDMDRAFLEFPFRKIDNLILMSDDGWKTVYFGKPYLYSLFAAPFAGLFGANGMVCFNLLLLVAMIWMGALYLARFNDGGLAALFATGFFLLSNGWSYAFWLHPEVLNMASVAGCLFFGLHRFGKGEGEAAPRWAMALSGAMLVPAAYNKPMLVALGAPLVLAWAYRRDLRRLGIWLAGAAVAALLVVGVATALTGHPTSYLGVKRQGVTLCEQGVMPIGPATSASANAQPAPDAARPTGGAWSWIFAAPEVGPSQFLENFGYFLWGRHTGLFLYTPFALVALLLFLLHGRRTFEQWTLFGALGVVAVFFVAWIPDNWQGGGGFVGNRYFIAAYPGFLFLLRKLQPRFLTGLGFTLGGLFLAPIMFTPFGAGGPEPTLQSHVRNRPFRYFPLELSLREVPGYDKRTIGETTFLGRRDGVLFRGESFWARGASRVEVFVSEERALDRAVFELRNAAPGNEITLELDGDRQVLSGLAAGEVRRVELKPGEPYKLRDHFGRRVVVHRLTLTARSGRPEAWTRHLPPNSCPTFASNDSFEESFYVGAEVSFLGQGESLDRDLFAFRWGTIEAPTQVLAGELFRFPVRLFNQSRFAWTADGVARVKLAYHWRRLDGRLVEWDGRRTELPLPVEPGARVSVEQEIKAPTEPGRYLLELDPLLERVAWFSEKKGGETFQVEIEVLPRP